MKKEIKLYLENEYGEIYRDMNVNWQLGFKRKKEELIYKGLDGSGVAQKILTSFAINLIKETDEKVDKLLENVQNEFNFCMSNIEINYYINRSISNDKSYIDIFYKDLKNYFDKKGLSFATSSIEIDFNNAKGNIEGNFRKAEKRLILINKSKKTKKKLSKSDWITIIGAVVTLFGIVITIIAIS